MVLRTEMQELLGLKDFEQGDAGRPGRLEDHDHGRGADPARLPARRPLARQPAAPAALRRLSARRAPAQPEHRPPARRGGGAGRRHAAARGRAGRHPPAGGRRRPRRPERDHRQAVQARARAAGPGGARRDRLLLVDRCRADPDPRDARRRRAARHPHDRAGGGLQHGQRLAAGADPRDAGRRRGAGPLGRRADDRRRDLADAGADVAARACSSCSTS